MSARSKITDKIVTLLKEIRGDAPYKSNLFTNVEGKLLFWDEVNDYPHVAVVPGSESREYLPASFKWGYLSISLKVYIKSDQSPLNELEEILEDIETVVDANIHFVYDEDTQDEIADMRISSITTDEGLLAPYGVAEVDLIIQYQVK
tara:strand:- start:24 stop:464 length:441 start_codon:yes stop_codon:yes gene_type:complete